MGHPCVLRKGYSNNGGVGGEEATLCTHKILDMEKDSHCFVTEVQAAM